MSFDSSGQPMWIAETETLDLTPFEAYFIQYLADSLPGLDEDPSARYAQFKEIYVQCRLDAQHEYGNDAALSP